MFDHIVSFLPIAVQTEQRAVWPRGIRKERPPRNSYVRSINERELHETNNYHPCLRDDRAIGVRTNRD